MPPAPEVVVRGLDPEVVVGGPGLASPGWRPGAGVTAGECEPIVEEQAAVANASPIAATSNMARLRTVIVVARPQDPAPGEGL
jgi:hypothetical protein